MEATSANEPARLFPTALRSHGMVGYYLLIRHRSAELCWRCRQYLDLQVATRSLSTAFLRTLPLSQRESAGARAEVEVEVEAEAEVEAGVSLPPLPPP